MSEVVRGLYAVHCAMVAGALNAATLRELEEFPTERIVLANAALGVGTAVINRDSPNQYEALGQTIFSSGLDGDELGISSLYVEVSDGTVIPESGTHEIEIWVGEWNVGSNTAGAQIVTQAFDVSGRTFVAGKVYGFDFPVPFDLDPARDYGFQVWWTTEDPSHDIALQRDTGQGFVDGGFLSRKDPDLSLPFDAVPATNSDLIFAFQTIPEPGVGMLIGCSLAGLLVRRQRA